MKAAKNMDSVFANNTEDQLDFDVMFDDDDTIIDVVAGVDEAGNLLTGEDFDWERFDALGESDDMVGEKPDFDYPNKEIGSNYEDSKDRKIEIGGEVGDGKEVSGREKSAESQAYDDKKKIDDAIGLNDKQQTALESYDILDLIEESEDPITDMDDADARAGKDTGVSDTEGKDQEVIGAALEADELLDLIENTDPDDDMGTMDHIKGTEAEKLVCPDCGKYPCECGSSKNESFVIIDDILDWFNEADDPITDMDDADARAGKDTGVSDTEGKDQELIGASIVGDVKGDPFVDLLDADARAGKDTGVSDTEGEKVHAVGAALEAGELLDLIETADESEEADPPEDAEDEGCCKEATEEDDDKDDAPDDSEDEGCKEASDISVADDFDFLSEDFDFLDEDADEGPLEDDDLAEREGKVSDTAVETESFLLNLLDEADDPITDMDDADAREGKDTGVDNTEGKDQEVIGAALEADDFLDDIIGEADPDDELIDLANLDDDLVGDEVVQDLVDDADIKVAKEETEAEKLTDEEEAQDDEDIEAVDSESDAGTSNFEADYDDDELIDAIINGDVEDI